MTLVVPNEGEAKALELILERALTLKLYSNDVTPAETDTAATYTEVAGGGYSDIDLSALGWTITEGAPSFGVQAEQEFAFSGASDSPGTVYGYYVVDPEGILMWAERFSEAVVPFEPEADAVIRITPRFEAS